MRGISEDFFRLKTQSQLRATSWKVSAGRARTGPAKDSAPAALQGIAAGALRGKRGGRGERDRGELGGRSWPGFDGNRGGKKGPPGGGDPRAGEQAATAGFHANRQGAETRRGGGARREEIRHRGGVDTSGKVAERQASAFYLFFLPRKEYLFLFFKQFFLNF